MPRPPRNPFYALLGIVGFLFTITAAAYCVSVLRGIQPAGGRPGDGEAHALDRLMDDHGTMILVVEIAILAVATVGAIWVDHVAGERIRRERAAREAGLADAATGADSGADSGADAS
jgi:hypothetical protein